MEIDLEDFHPRFQAPADDYKADVLQSQKTSEELFIEQWDGAEKTSTALYELYKDFCIAQELPYCKSALSLGKKLLSFLRDGIIDKRVTMTAALYYKP